MTPLYFFKLFIPANYEQGGRLIVNVDVSNSVFYGDWPMEIMATQITGNANTLECGEKSKKIQTTFMGKEKESLTFLKLKKLKKIRFKVRYRGASESTSSNITGSCLLTIDTRGNEASTHGQRILTAKLL